MEKYFDDPSTITEEEVLRALRNATVQMAVVPMPVSYTHLRRLVDVSHDVIITEEDCGTLRGLVCTDLKNNDEVIATLYRCV